MAETLGLYIHIPFCDTAKCPYCDFYSVPMRQDLAQAYLGALRAAALGYAGRAHGRVVDTIYFGGGTPSLLGPALGETLLFIKDNFNVAPGAEITLEANPTAAAGGLFPRLAKAGFNRLSLGMQSASPDELKALGRRHTPQDTARAVGEARAASFANISLDLMLATPGQSIESLEASIAFAASLGPEHISAYLLKLEPGTPFFEQKEGLGLPDDDAQAEFYLAACGALERSGFLQYEISNFAKPGFESRHNLKYWNCDEYIGLGPGAHSFFEGRRFYYGRSLEGFIAGMAAADDGSGGSLDEYVMLALRLSAGLSKKELGRRYGAGLGMFDGGLVDSLRSAGYIAGDQNAIRLTQKGFLMSNSVISALLFKKSAAGDWIGGDFYS